MTDPNLLTIGAFASASRLSQKALRLYDDLGLLPPVRVDEQNGYRYYSPAQLPDARLIGLLRQLDLPLADIREVLHTPAQARTEAVRNRWTAIQAQHARRERLAMYTIHTLLGESQMTPTYDVQPRFVPAQSVVTLTRRVFVPDLSRTIGRSMQDLYTLISTQGAQPSGAPFVIYHGEVNTDSDGPIEVCVPYTGTLSPTGDVALRLEPEHHEAFVILNKRDFEFPGLLTAYDATSGYARTHLPSPLHCREVYPYDWDQAGPDDPAGEIAWPFIPRERA